ncbi:DNA gyrase subunit A [Treponema sp. R6D11]
MSEFDNQKIIKVELSKEMKKSYIDYAMSVIVGRALPDVRDGLKPVHRRILYTMFEDGFTPDKAYRKCATTVGDVLGRYHPHGDAAVYDALVRMAQDFSLRYPQIDGHGNFGSVDGDPPAAYRYTEARMSKVSLKMLTDIDKDTVDFIPNFDERLKEPVVLPSRFPNLLVNGSSGIAVGMATNIPPHSLNETIDAVIALIDNEEIEIDELMEHVKGPDFPTAGIIVGKAGIRSAYHTGRGKVVMRARCEIEEYSNGKQRIVATEIPYQVNKSVLIKRIADLVKEKRIDGITDIRDESDRDGMRIVIELRRDANANIVLNKLYKYSSMQENFSINMLALHDGQPKIMNLKQILTYYLDFQKRVIVRRTEFEKKKAEARIHILEGLKIAIDNLDAVIKTIRESYDDAKAKLMTNFGLSDIQADAILEMKLRRLQGLEREKIESEYNELLALIKRLIAILGDPQLVLDIIKTELNEIKEKFGDDRRTEIIHDESEIDIEDLIPNEENVITYTHFGYIKRTLAENYQSQSRGGRGKSGLATREEDFPTEIFVAKSHANLMFFTSKGRMYKLKAYQVAETGRNAKGTAIVNLLPLEPEEKVTAIIPLREKADGAQLVMLTKNGVIKRTSLENFASNRKSGLKAIELDEGDTLIRVKQTTGNDELVLITSRGMSIRINENNVRSMGRSARGVKALNLAEGDYLVGMCLATLGSEDVSLLIVSENGFGKRADISQYRLQNRGGKGLRTYNVTEETGKIAGVKTVKPSDDIIVITSNGVIIRVDSESIRQVNRATKGKGVRVVRLGDEETVISMSSIPKGEIDDSEIEDSEE